MLFALILRDEMSGFDDRVWAGIMRSEKDGMSVSITFIPRRNTTWSGEPLNRGSYNLNFKDGSLGARLKQAPSGSFS